MMSTFKSPNEFEYAGKIYTPQEVMHSFPQPLIPVVGAIHELNRNETDQEFEWGLLFLEQMQPAMDFLAPICYPSKETLDKYTKQLHMYTLWAKSKFKGSDEIPQQLIQPIGLYHYMRPVSKLSKLADELIIHQIVTMMAVHGRKPNILLVSDKLPDEALQGAAVYHIFRASGRSREDYFTTAEKHDLPIIDFYPNP